MVCPPLRNLKICLCFFIHMFNTTDPPRNFCLFLYISSIETCIQCVGSSTRSGVRSIFSVSSMCTSLSLSLSRSTYSLQTNNSYCTIDGDTDMCLASCVRCLSTCVLDSVLREQNISDASLVRLLGHLLFALNARCNRTKNRSLSVCVAQAFAGLVAGDASQDTITRIALPQALPLWMMSVASLSIRSRYDAMLSLCVQLKTDATSRQRFLGMDGWQRWLLCTCVSMDKKYKHDYHSLTRYTTQVHFPPEKMRRRTRKKKMRRRKSHTQKHLRRSCWTRSRL